MRKFFIVLLLTSSCFASSSNLILDSSKNIFLNKSTLEDVKSLREIAKRELNKSKSDEQYYVAYDLVKTLDVSLALKKVDKVSCTNAKIEIFTLYGVKEIESYRKELPSGALLGVKVLDKVCGDSIVK